MLNTILSGYILCRGVSVLYAHMYISYGDGVFRVSYFVFAAVHIANIMQPT